MTVTEVPLDLLFVPTPRWGWELKLPMPARPSPERNNPPSRVGIRMVSVGRQFHLGAVAALMFFGWLAATILDFGVLHLGGRGNSAGLGVVLVHFASLALAVCGVYLTRRVEPDSRKVTAGMVVAYVAAAAGAFFAPYVSLGLEWIWILSVKSAANRRLVPHPADEAVFQGEWAKWHRRVAEFEAAEQRRVETTPLWYPVEPNRQLLVLGVYGGTALGWRFLLGTLGPSLLSTGHVAVVDLSRRHVDGPLVELARRRHLPVAAVSVPSQVSAVDLFGDMSWEALTSLLVEAIYANQADPAVSRRERQEDRSVLSDVAELLDPSGPVSFGRLRAGLQVVTKERRAPADGSDVLTLDEYERLTRLYGEVQRAHGGVLERATRLERLLKDLLLIDGRGVRDDDAVPVLKATSGPGLDVFRIDDRIEELDNEMLVDVLFQLVLRRVRVGAARPDTLLILGADRVRRQDLENLTAYCEREHVRAYLFFEHLRMDAVDLIGGSGAAAAFLALPNHREAQEAVAFIGSDHKWVESQRTRGFSNSVTDTTGSERGGSRSFSGFSESWGETSSTAYGRSREESTSDQRVFEPLVEPNVLMGLPVTGLIYVEVQATGRRRVANVDFRPEIAISARTSRQPFALAGG